MAELTSFDYVSGNSLLHRSDPRFKILCIILLSLAILNVSFGGLGLLTVILLGVFFYARLPLASGLKELRYFLIFLFLIFCARALSVDGRAVIQFSYFTVSIQGLYSGILICWRLALIVVLGLAFISTTPPWAVKVAAQWLLKHVPLIPEKKVAVMMGLIMRFVPVILYQAAETAEAQKARGIENRKNPVYRLIKLGFPILRRTFERADDLAVAMEARCFTESRTDPELVAQIGDWLVLVAVGCLSIALLLVTWL